jgi:hypothetical protein
VPSCADAVSREGHQGVRAEAACNVAVDLPALPMPPAITKSDEEFAELGMEFVWGADEIDLAALNVLFAAVRHACVASGTPEKMPQHGSVPEAV